MLNEHQNNLEMIYNIVFFNLSINRSALLNPSVQSRKAHMRAYRTGRHQTPPSLSLYLSTEQFNCETLHLPASSGLEGGESTWRGRHKLFGVVCTQCVQARASWNLILVRSACKQNIAAKYTPQLTWSCIYYMQRRCTRMRRALLGSAWCVLQTCNNNA